VQGGGEQLLLVSHDTAVIENANSVFAQLGLADRFNHVQSAEEALSKLKESNQDASRRVSVLILDVDLIMNTDGLWLGYFLQIMRKQEALKEQRIVCLSKDSKY